MGLLMFFFYAHFFQTNLIEILDYFDCFISWYLYTRKCVKTVRKEKNNKILYECENFTFYVISTEKAVLPPSVSPNQSTTNLNYVQKKTTELTTVA